MSIINQWINRYILAGRESTTDSAPTNEVVVDATGAMKTSLSGSILTNVEGTLGQPTPGKAAFIGIKDGAGNLSPLNAVSNIADANTLAGGVPVGQFNFNGGTWDRWRNNTEGVLLASAARTVTAPTPNQTNYNAKGVTVTLDVTAIGTGTLTLSIVGVIGGTKVVKLMIGATVNAIGRYTYELSPGSGAVSGAVTARAQGRLPRTWYVQVDPVDASAWTYSVDHSLHV